MIYYMNTDLPDREHFWRPVPKEFTVEDAHRENIWFKIGDTIYPIWSEEFERAVTWDALLND